MNYDKKKKMIDALQKKLIEATGSMKNMLKYKIKILETDTSNLDYSMGLVLSSKLFKLIIKNQKRLLKEYKILKDIEKNNPNISDIINIISTKLIFFEQELSTGCNGKYTDFINSSGFINLSIKHLELDPSYDIKYLCINIDNKKAAFVNVYDNKTPIKLHMRSASVIEFLLYSENSKILYGASILPSIIFVDKNDDDMRIKISIFNYITFNVKFMPSCILKNSSRDYKCLLKKGHALDREYNISIRYCNVCEKRCSLFGYVNVCLKCNVLTHEDCSNFILFKCLHSGIINLDYIIDDLNESTQITEETKIFKDIKHDDNQSTCVDDNNIVEINTKLKNININDKKQNIAKKESYDINHTFTDKTSTGINFCRHCGTIIDIGDRLLNCNACGDKYHKKCSSYIFSSCGIEYELRHKMIELQKKRIENMADNGMTTINEFEFLDIIGRGKFAKVIAARHKESKELISLKLIPKQYIYSRRDLDCVKVERNTLRKLSEEYCPFILKMKYYFQDKYNIYFGLEYISGGNLLNYVVNTKFSESQIRLYIAEILCGIEHLHNMNIAYRGLKLENILLNKDGHIKLSDFGLAKMDMKADMISYTYYGSLDTIAPEVLNGTGYYRSVDFWSLGIIAYELFHNKSPFQGETPKELATQIINLKIVVKTDISCEAQDFITRLLIKNPKYRLGYKNSGIYNIKSHQWFDGINWDDVKLLKYKPEFIPKDLLCDVKNSSKEHPITISPTISIENFDEYFAKYEK